MSSRAVTNGGGRGGVEFEKGYMLIDPDIIALLVVGIVVVGICGCVDLKSGSGENESFWNIFTKVAGGFVTVVGSSRVS
jgi:hypothetical protein